MNNSKLISVIVPFFNAESHIEKCIKCLVKQTYSNIEIVLVDDNSNDNSHEICSKYSLKYDNIRYHKIHNTNEGASDARNYGLKVCKGDYIFFLDSDDLISHVTLEILYQKIVENSADIAICDYTSDLNKIEYNSSDTCKIVSIESLFKRLINNQTTTAVWGKLYKKKLFENLEFPIGKHNEDMFITPLVYEKSKKALLINSKYYYYNTTNESLCRSEFNLNKLAMIDATEFWTIFFKSKSVELYNMAIVKEIQTKLFFLKELSKEKKLKKEYLDIKKKTLNVYQIHKSSIKLKLNDYISIFLLKSNLLKFVIHLMK